MHSSSLPAPLKWRRAEMRRDEHEDSVNCTAVSLSGRYHISAGDDGTAIVRERKKDGAKWVRIAPYLTLPASLRVLSCPSRARKYS